MTASQPDILTAGQVAEMCGVSPVTVNRWVKNGRLQPLDPFNPYRQRQPRFRFRRADVERLAQPIQRAG